MNPLLLNEQTMSSVTIAELCEKRHDNVLRDLRELEKQGVIDLLRFEEISKDAINRDRTIYHLPKRETLILTSGYSAEQRAAIIDRWLELERMQANHVPVPRIPSKLELAREYVAALEKLDVAEKQIQAMVPAVEAHDRIAASNGLVNLRDAAKDLQVSPQRTLFDWLASNKWIYRERAGKPWRAYQDRINQGLLQHKVQADRAGTMRDQVMVTPQGLLRLARVFNTRVQGRLCA